MRQYNRNQQLIINMSASFVAYGVSLFISFFLSPYIVRTIGVEANGFVGLANNFVSYASLITIALNSLAGRFITISLTKGDDKEANKYFTSVYYANLFIALLLTIIGSLVILFLEKLINIPQQLLPDVRLLFIILFLNCILSIVGSVFSVATFARNMLYLESLRNIEANIARALCIIGLFALGTPKVCYVGIGALVSGVYILFRNICYTKQLLPEISIHRKHFDIQAIWELVSSGIWNTITRLGQLLLDGLDLLITNLFINSTAMGIMSLSKTVPSLITGVLNSIVGIFSPDFTILYAQNNKTELLASIQQSMKIMGTLINVPIVVLIVCGEEFFQLWQPTQDAQVLQHLFLLNIGCLVFSGGINCLYSLFTVVNKIKANSIAVLVGGAISTGIVLILLKTTTIGIYAVAGVGTIVSIIRNLAFTAPYGAHCLGLKWYVFYPNILKPIVLVALGSLVGFGLGCFFPATTWFIWFLKAIAIGLCALTIAFFFIFDKADRSFVFSKVKRRRST